MVTGNTYSDSARRAADIVTLAAVAGHAGEWVAIRLSDGGTDGVHYPSKDHAAKYQLHESLCAYFRVPPDGMTPRLAELWMTWHRALYDAGHRPGYGKGHIETPMTLRFRAGRPRR